MTALPVPQRDFHIFLSHASADKALVVEKLFRWLTDVAGMRVWYDADSLSGGVAFGSALADAILQCRALVVVISKAALQSGWVEEEYQLAMVHQKEFRDFRIIPVLIDDSEVPGFLKTKNYLRMPNAEITIEFCDGLLKALSNFDPGMQASLQYGRVRDIYVSRTWRDNESPFADAVCTVFADRGFRLIGDSRDQRVDDKTRVRGIMESCGGLLAVLPHRAGDPGGTSPYMIEEIQAAADLKLPYAIVAEKGVTVPDALAAKAVKVIEADAGTDVSSAVSTAASELSSSWITPPHPHYVFYATDFDEAHAKRTQIVRKMIERVTAMQCVMGEEIQQAVATSLQQEISEKIIQSFLVVADITGDNLNTIIEAGIARGARVRTVLISGDQRRDPPFMFRDQQIFYYADDVELLGRVNKLIYPFRRRVINYYLGKK